MSVGKMVKKGKCVINCMFLSKRLKKVMKFFLG